MHHPTIYFNTKNKVNYFSSYIVQTYHLEIQANKPFSLRIIFCILLYIIEFKFNTPIIVTYSNPMCIEKVPNYLHF